MSGNRTGGLLAAETNKAKHGADFYARIGAAGGKAGKTGGFYANRELARTAGAKGGRISRKGTKTTDIPAVDTKKHPHLPSYVKKLLHIA